PHALPRRRPRRRPVDRGHRPRLRAGVPVVSAEALISRFRRGFPLGHTEITREGEAHLDTGVDFGVHRFRGGESFEETHPKETAWLLLDGEADVGGEAEL